MADSPSPTRYWILKDNDKNALLVNPSSPTPVTATWVTTADPDVRPNDITYLWRQEDSSYFYGWGTFEPKPPVDEQRMFEGLFLWPKPRPRQRQKPRSRRSSSRRLDLTPPPQHRLLLSPHLQNPLRLRRPLRGMKAISPRSSPPPPKRRGASLTSLPREQRRGPPRSRLAGRRRSSEKPRSSRLTTITSPSCSTATRQSVTPCGTSTN